LLVVVTAAGGEREQAIDSLEGRWWMPDDIVFIDTLSYGATAKI
jgi:hypothetical protein